MSLCVHFPFAPNPITAIEVCININAAERLSSAAHAALYAAAVFGEGGGG